MEPGSETEKQSKMQGVNCAPDPGYRFPRMVRRFAAALRLIAGTEDEKPTQPNTEGDDVPEHDDAEGDNVITDIDADKNTTEGEDLAERLPDGAAAPEEEDFPPGLVGDIVAEAAAAAPGTKGESQDSLDDPSFTEDLQRILKEDTQVVSENNTEEISKVPTSIRVQLLDGSYARFEMDGEECLIDIKRRVCVNELPYAEVMCASRSSG